MKNNSRPSKVNRTIEALTEQNIESILCTEEARQDRAPRAYRLVQSIASFCGTIGFLVWNFVLTALWIALNSGPHAPDPYPFTFLLFVVSIEAIFLSIMILISQNMSSAENERRHHLDLQINLLNERETTALLRLVVQMADQLGVSAEHQEEVRRFAHKTDPAAVLGQIVAAEQRHSEAAAGARGASRQ